MSEHQDWFPAPESAARDTHCTADDYDRMYAQSIDDADTFWAEQAKRLDWMTAPTKIANWSFDPVSIKWYEDGVLSLCHNAVDRHVEAGRGDTIAFIFEHDDPLKEPRRVSYGELLAEVIRMANALKQLGVAKGERVAIYMPMCVEGAVAMLACARIGAVHSVVVRRLFARRDCRTDRGLRQPFRHLRRQRVAWRKIRSAKGQYRCGAGKGGRGRGGTGYTAHRRDGCDERRSRLLVSRPRRYRTIARANR